MFSPSIPDYLDPRNWQQISSNQDQSGGLNLQLLAPPQAAAGGGGMDWVSPSLLTEIARLADIPMPQAPLKCPRCDSTNTKFCYFNNYSLSQPRHFCKTCRRYWTRGGTLRRVPVGGGCRKSKRSRAAANLLGRLPPEFTQLLLAAPLSQIAQYDAGGNDIGFNSNNVETAGTEMNIPVESATLLPSGELEQWRLQPPLPNFPSLGGFDQLSLPPPPGVFLFQSGVEFPGYTGEQSSPAGAKHLSQMLTAPISSVKVEDNNHKEPNLAMQLMGIPGNDQWGSIAWTDRSNFTSSSTTNN